MATEYGSLLLHGAKCNTEQDGVAVMLRLVSGKCSVRILAGHRLSWQLFVRLLCLSK
jgi:hypothetical protein